ncbi:hypothetical protein ACKVMT_16275 [Halobacteriales archaeon Cl-PHB]
MSLKCSVFGHSFGDATVDREREEDGSEVVITIREVETCGRCGEQRVVSENKEVTTLETPDADEMASDEADAEAVDAEADTADPVDTGQVSGSARSDDLADADDAEILDEGDEDDAVASEPVVPDAETGEPAAEPVADVADDAPPGPEEETDPATDDGVILEDEDDPEPERQPGQWPEEPEDDGPDWEPPSFEEESDMEPGLGDSPEVEPTGTAVTVPEGTFHCPECGFSTPVEASSLREGDFCPECHTGTLDHQAEAE